MNKNKMLLMLIASGLVISGCSKNVSRNYRINTVPDTNFEIVEKYVDIDLIDEARVFFDFNKYELKEEGKKLLDDIAKNTNNIRLLGHADKIGTDKYNMDLSKRRAIAVKYYLQSKGVSNIHTFYAGERMPIVKCKSDDVKCLSPNRRVDIVYKLDENLSEIK